MARSVNLPNDDWWSVGLGRTRKDVVKPIKVPGSFEKGRGSPKLSYAGNPKILMSCVLSLMAAMVFGILDDADEKQIRHRRPYDDKNGATEGGVGWSRSCRGDLKINWPFEAGSTNLLLFCKGRSSPAPRALASPVEILCLRERLLGPRFTAGRVRRSVLHPCFSYTRSS